MTLSEYEARALRGALDRANESSLRWLPEYLDRMERLIDDYRQVVERHEALAAIPAGDPAGLDVERLRRACEAANIAGADRIAAEYAALAPRGPA